jgi:hypothetical protein
MITPADIDTIEEIGSISGQPVKLIRTRGGFWIAVARLRGKPREEVLSGGSHSAIVRYKLAKQFPDFQSLLMKNENAMPITVDKHSHFLCDDLRKSGHDIYSVQTESNVEFHVTKYNVKLAQINGTIGNDSLILSKINISPDFTRALAGAASEKALSCGLKRVSVEE